jgi:argininosuccinate synthase
VTGTVRVKLYRGSIVIAGRKSVHSLYNAKLATYTEEDTFDHKASEGFIKIFGLPVKTYNQVNGSGVFLADPSALFAGTDAKK